MEQLFYNKQKVAMLFKIARVPVTYRFLRVLSSKKNVPGMEMATSDRKFIPIYKFPYIRVFSVVNRLKLYQTVLTVVTVPVAITLSQVDIISKDMVFATMLLGRYSKHRSLLRHAT